MQESVVITKRQTGLAIFLSLFAIAFGGLGFFMLREDLKEQYPSLFNLTIDIIPIVLALVGVIGLFYLDRYVLYPYKLEIWSIFGYLKKTLPLDNIHGWAETKHKSKYDEYKKLTLYTSHRSIALSSQYNAWYDQLKKGLTKGKKEVEYKVKLLDIVGLLSLFSAIMLFSVFLLSIANTQYHAKVTPLREDYLMQITGTLAEKPSGKKEPLRLNLKQYPYFTFLANGSAYYATDIGSFLSEVTIGDSVFVNIDKNEYKKKISNELPLSFWDKYDGYSTIHIYGLSNTRHEYLNIDDYNIREEQNVASDKKDVWIIILFSLVMFTVALFTLLKEVAPKYGKYKQQRR